MKRALACTVLAACSALAFAADTHSLESGLLHAMQLKKGTTERTGTSGQAIRAYQHAGLVSKTPRQRFDSLVLSTPYFLAVAVILIDSPGSSDSKCASASSIRSILVELLLC